MSAEDQVRDAGIRRSRDDRPSRAPQRAQRRSLRGAPRASRRERGSPHGRDHRRRVGVLRRCRPRDPLRAHDEGADGPVDTFRPRSTRCSTRSSINPAPVVAAVNGPARARDAARGRMRPSRRSARGALRDPVGRLGVHLSPRNHLAPGWSSPARARARDILLAGRSVDGEEAFRSASSSGSPTTRSVRRSRSRATSRRRRRSRCAATALAQPGGRSPVALARGARRSGGARGLRRSQAKTARGDGPRSPRSARRTPGALGA